jgi:hypothetical protein
MYQPAAIIASAKSGTVICVFICPICKKEKRVEVPIVGLKLREAGVHIQAAFPNLSKDDRELFVSGTCSECWEKMCGKDEK